jgi:carbonic anhydrase/acetyltransferase-like protein (isoleucine patch superfamily)
MIQSFNNHHPFIHKHAFVHPSAVIIGQVFIDEGASIWPGVVLRGDMGMIKIGKNTSIQDASVAHMTMDFSHTIVGDNVTVGHGVILHGCVIEDGCLIGMGSTILDQTTIGQGSFVAAGSLVTGNKIFEPESFICGSPAKFMRPINDRERQICISSALRYRELALKYQPH